MRGFLPTEKTRPEKTHRPNLIGWVHFEMLFWRERPLPLLASFRRHVPLLQRVHVLHMRAAIRGWPAIGT